MRRLILTIPIFAAISLIGALLSAPATAQGDPVPELRIRCSGDR